MRPVVRGDHPKDENGQAVIYCEYAKARRELINRMGEYCSYCEMHLDASLAVEHVQSKKPAGTVIIRRELDWYNFLLACTNCNSIKGDKDVVLSDYLWPDSDNTFFALKYSEGGLVSPADCLHDELRTLALNTIDLTGLDKTPLNDPKASDRRLINRRETWDIAERSKQHLQCCDTPHMRTQIVFTAQAKGYWSVWMTVFKDDADMLQRFIQAFTGTCKECFDPDNGYAPTARVCGKC